MNIDIDKLKKAFAIQNEVYNTPKRAFQLMVELGIYNQDGSPSKNYYSNDEIEKIYIDGKDGVSLGYVEAGKPFVFENLKEQVIERCKTEL